MTTSNPLNDELFALKSCLFSIVEASPPLTSIQEKQPLVSFPMNCQSVSVALAVTLFQLKVAGLPSSGFAIKQPLFENKLLFQRRANGEFRL